MAVTLRAHALPSLPCSSRVPAGPPPAPGPSRAVRGAAGSAPDKPEVLTSVRIPIAVQLLASLAIAQLPVVAGEAETAAGETEASAEAGPDVLLSSSLGDDPFARQEARRQMRTAVRRAARRTRSEPWPSTTAGVSPELEAIAACESGGDPRAVSSSGAYRGKYQFSPATWQALGGSGDPAAAPEPEQDRRAATLYAQSGAGQWPACAG